jgi:hypothetical protein
MDACYIPEKNIEKDGKGKTRRESIYTRELGV